MIILQTGVPGSGKTASVVNILMTDETYTHFTDKDGQKKKRPLFVNGIEDLQLEHQLLTDEQIKEQPFQDFLPYGALVVIDEAQRLMGNRPAASKVPPFIEALATHRHHGLDIVLIMKKSIDHGWFGFFDPTDGSPHHKKGDDGSAAAKAALAEHNARQAAKPPDKPDKQPEIRSTEEKAKGKTHAQRLMEIAKGKKSW